jgi:hypothetical protein
MTAKCALVKALLDGRVLNIKNVFRLIGLTNAPREISRMIEKPFGVVVSRTPREGKSRYGRNVTWYDYRLNRTEHNMNGIIKMERYVEENKSKPEPTQINKPKKQLDLYGDI